MNAVSVNPPPRPARRGGPRPGPRLYVPEALAQGRQINLTPAQAQYLGVVLRLAPGAPLRLFNGRDGEWRGEIAQIGKKTALISLLSQSLRQTGRADLWLVFAPVKTLPTGWHGRKAAEMGISRLQPVITERTIVRRISRRRLAANAVEGAEQSGGLHLPAIGEACPLADLLGDWPAQRRIFLCDEEAPARSPLALLQNHTGPAALFIGPEGGFAPAERARLRAMPGATLSLGPRLLRADSAALAALALFQAACGDWRTKPGAPPQTAKPESA